MPGVASERAVIVRSVATNAASLLNPGHRKTSGFFAPLRKTGIGSLYMAEKCDQHDVRKVVMVRTVSERAVIVRSAATNAASLLNPEKKGTSALRCWILRSAQNDTKMRSE
jgi:hypothetical protein